MVDKTDVMKVLKKCYDPEIPINIVDLGLIYDVRVKESKVKIKMTLTAPGCPMHSMITEDIKQNVQKIKGVKDVDIELIWDPPWSPERMSASARKKLGI
jgi:FeS assembly SUF system protein